MAESTTHTSAPALKFHETIFDPVPHTVGEIWLRYHSLSEALGYSKAHSALNLYGLHPEEFTDRMTALVTLPSAGGPQQVRIFSLRGAHLLGMFARTARAAEFRRWVLDILEREAERSTPAAIEGPLPQPPAPVPALISATLERVIAERDMLRRLLAERTLTEQPHLNRAIRYYSIPGLTTKERATLMGWDSERQWFECINLLVSLGVVARESDLVPPAIGLETQS